MPTGCMKRNGPPESFKDLLTCAAAFFKEFKITYRITDGTLIGAERPGSKCVPWDDDIDVTLDTSSNGNKIDYSIIDKFNNWKNAPSSSRCGKVSKMIFTHQQMTFSVSVSIGLATWDGKESAESLYARTEKALVRAKKDGGGQYWAAQTFQAG